MPFKINISETGKTYKTEATNEGIIGKKIGDKIEGKEIKNELDGYELEITGTSDIAGFPGMKKLEGQGLKRVLLTRGFGMRQTKPRGLRLKKSMRGNTISKDTVQINTNVIKQGSKKLEEIFPEQIKAREEKAEKKKQMIEQARGAKEQKPVEQTSAQTQENKPEEKKE